MMSNPTTQARPSELVTVEGGSKTQYYFVPITGLQEGTKFKDIWDHLKRTTLKRIEHVEIYPDSREGWICVHKRRSFVKVLVALQLPVFISSTGYSRMILASDKNKYEAVTIRLPQTCSQHVSSIIENATNAGPNNKSNPVVTHGTCLKTDITHNDSQSLSTPHNYRPTRPVIAHGSYIPGKAPESSTPVVNQGYQWADPYVCQYTSPWGTYTDPTYDFWCYHTPYVLFTPYSGLIAWDLQTTGPCQPQVFHTVTLSEIHSDVTQRQIELLVEQVVGRRRLRDRNYWFLDGTTLAVRNKSDAKKLRDSLDGRRLRGVPIKAVRGKQQAMVGF